MEPPLDLALVWNFVIALLIGAMVGIEREKRKRDEGGGTIAGLRTFILFAELGAVAGWMAAHFAAPWFAAAIIAIAAAPIVAGYVVEAHRGGDEGIGLTTEIALIVVCSLGAMTMLGQRELAVGLGVVTAAVLAYKQPLHGLVERLGWDDVYAGVRLLIASFVILPLLPDHPVDPWGALNPYTLWLLVILISGLSLVGYVATRWLGSDRGLLLTGITGGLVSSTAVTLSFARQGHADGAAVPMLAAGVLVAWLVMFGRIAVEILVVNPHLMPALAVPLGAMALAAAACIVFLMRRGARAGGPTAGPGMALKNPFSLTAATKFAAFFAAVLLVVKIVQHDFAQAGTLVVAALAGLTDVDAITLSMAEYARDGGERWIAASAVIVAAVTNTLVKCGMVVALGGRDLAWPVAIGTAAIVAAGIAGQAAAITLGL